MGRGRFYRIAKVGLGSFVLALDFAISALIEKKRRAVRWSRNNRSYKTSLEIFPDITIPLSAKLMLFLFRMHLSTNHERYQPVTMRRHVLVTGTELSYEWRSRTGWWHSWRPHHLWPYRCETSYKVAECRVRGLRARGSFSPFMGASAGMEVRRGEARRGEARWDARRGESHPIVAHPDVEEEGRSSARRMRVVSKRRVLAAQRGS